MIGGAVIAAALTGAALSLVPGTNGSFDAVKELPKEWKVVEYVAGASTVTVQRGDAYDGSQFLQLKASKQNHTRVFLPVDVDPQTTYKFTAQVRVPTGKDVPAVLMLDGATTTTASVQGDNKWHKTTLYIRTGDNKQVTPVLSLGRFGELAQGEADFDAVSLEKADTVPDGAIVADAVGATGAADSGSSAAPTSTPPGKTPSKWLVPLAILLLAIVAGCAWALKRGDDNDPALHPELKTEADEAPADDAPADTAEPATVAPTADKATPSDGDAG
ncbi:MAG: hypothetical protein J7513_05495 [Solirubrobacteraceae bacterium]|nr:hypothetical protein [Solirubrobacteraceae bacterium]